MARLNVGSESAAGYNLNVNNASEPLNMMQPVTCHHPAVRGPYPNPNNHVIWQAQAASH